MINHEYSQKSQFGSITAIADIRGYLGTYQQHTG